MDGGDKSDTRIGRVTPAAVSCDPDIMGGSPVFAGTRVPIEIVLGSLDEAIELDELKEAYEFLTPAHIEAARRYAHLHPRSSAPKRRELPSGWKVLFSKTIPPRAQPASGEEHDD